MKRIIVILAIATFACGSTTPSSVDAGPDTGDGKIYLIVDDAGDYIVSNEAGSYAEWCFANGTGCRPIP